MFEAWRAGRGVGGWALNLLGVPGLHAIVLIDGLEVLFDARVVIEAVGGNMIEYCG